MKTRLLIFVALTGAIIACWLLISWYKPAVVIHPDSVYYMKVAKNISAGKLYVDHRAGVDLYMTAPLYPLFVKVVSGVTRDFEEAGRLVSVVSALLLVLVLFGWGIRAGGVWVGLMAACLGACSQAKVGNMVLTESLFAMSYIAAAWLLWESVRDATAPKAILAGLAFGIATLTREPGFMGVPFGAAAILLFARKKDNLPKLREKAVQAGLFAVVTCLVISPYWVYSLVVRGTWWGSRFAERAGHGTEILSGVPAFFSAFPAAVRSMGETYTIAVAVAVLAGLLIPSKNARSDGAVRIFILAFIVWNVLALGALGVTKSGLWSRYIYPVTPLMLLLAVRGAMVAGELAGRLIVRKKLRGEPYLKTVVSVAVTAALIITLVNKAQAERDRAIQPSYQARWFVKGAPEVAMDFLSNYVLLPGTYVYDRKPYVAYYLDATWAGLPTKITLHDLEREAEKRPVLLVVNSSLVKDYGYDQLKPLLAAKDIPQGWNLPGMYFFSAYGKSGRLMAIYSYGDAYRSPPPIKPEDFTYEDHMRRATKWMVTGRIDRVQAHARAAIELDPSKPEAYLPLSRILMVQGISAERIDIMKEALDLVKKAYALDPQNPEIRNLMCIISEAKSDFDGSEPICR